MRKSFYRVRPDLLKLFFRPHCQLYKLSVAQSVCFSLEYTFTVFVGSNIPPDFQHPLLQTLNRNTPVTRLWHAAEWD